MLSLKHSARDLPPGAYDKLPIKEKLKYNRFILCHDKLSEHVEKQPAKVNTLDETTRIVGGFEYVITSDLTDSTPYCRGKVAVLRVSFPVPWLLHLPPLDTGANQPVRGAGGIGVRGIARLHHDWMVQSVG